MVSNDIRNTMRPMRLLRMNKLLRYHSVNVALFVLLFFPPFFLSCFADAVCGLEQFAGRFFWRSWQFERQDSLADICYA